MLYMAMATAFLISYRTVISTVVVSGMETSSVAARAASRRISSFSTTSSSSFLHSSNSSTSSEINNLSADDLMAAAAEPLLPPKRILLLRHGQAVHNPRAEAAREKGCSFDEFLRLMGEDDAFDSPLTELGEKQALSAGRQEHIKHALNDVEMVVSSPFSRALKTADLVHQRGDTKRVCIEDFREINGKLLNAKRRTRTELEDLYPHWNFDHIPMKDESWTEELEDKDNCAKRGYNGLLWIAKQPQKKVMVACHGGLLNLTLNTNRNVVLLDRRRKTDRDDEEQRCITKRFGNCEMREFIMTGWAADDMSNAQQDGEEQQVVLTLEEVTMELQEADIYDEEKVEMV
jgi:broad specificity phosphatase PhoE